MMKVHQIKVGRMDNFTYIVYDDVTRKAIVIDPSWNLDKVQNTISADNLTPTRIVNTHYHFDHTLGNEALSKSHHMPIMQHRSSTIFHHIGVDEGDTIPIGEVSLRVLHTPGHSQDSICLVGDGVIFTGDTLFVGSCGRVDLPGGDARKLYHSLQRLAGLDETLIVYPGHNYGAEETSTIGYEKETNLVLRVSGEDEFVAMLGQS